MMLSRVNFMDEMQSEKRSLLPEIVMLTNPMVDSSAVGKKTGRLELPKSTANARLNNEHYNRTTSTAPNGACGGSTNSRVTSLRKPGSSVARRLFKTLFLVAMTMNAVSGERGTH
jgi:hypothetical protein